ncbi:uncharacterized protein [Amphiura filiformis]|uniref:uncharacterized protein n=1 Tax=Amphiura filiformis TaxID=82378 RepID=UPI003B21BACE
MTILSISCVIMTCYLQLFDVTMATTEPPSQCNTCCQAGIPGIPGQHGLQGSKGDAGVKGEKGDSCDIDPSIVKGESGQDGLPGSEGRAGRPGKTGPAGPPGLPGQPGERGEKGEISEIPERRKSAFTAVNRQDKAVTTSSPLGDWDHVVVNKGNDFNQTTGKFTCRVPGIYVFMFSLCDWDANHPIGQLMKNGEALVGTYSNIGGHDQATNGALVELAEGDQVWIGFGNSGTVNSNNWKYTTFSGYLLYEDLLRGTMAVFSFICITTVFYVIFHCGGIVSSQTTHEPVENHSPSINTCFQNGIPGIPGQHGLPGSRGDPGVKGDKGDSCQSDGRAKGEKGEQGEILEAQSSPCSKGNMGTPGKVGPQGPVGAEGPRGGLGSKGEKGEPCVAPPKQKSAFTAVNTQDKIVSVGDVLGNWDNLVTNKGNDFDQTSGKFTCSVPGTYAFMFSCGYAGGGTGPVCFLNINGETVVGIFTRTAQRDQVSNGATLDLAVGEEVWISIGYQAGTVSSNHYKYTTFSGYLLFEN